MDIKGIIAISGKPGLFKVAAQGRNNIIVQSLENEKKFPAFASDKISALDDISIYTVDEDVPLADVYEKLAKKEDYKKSISHKETSAKLREHLATFLPDFDEERVYDADIKKLFQWYNILVDHGYVTKETKKDAEKESDSSDKKASPKKAKANPKGAAKKGGPKGGAKALSGAKGKSTGATKSAGRGK